MFCLFFLGGGGITDCLKAVLLLQEVAKTAHEAGKRITSNRPWMLSDNVMVFFLKRESALFFFLFFFLQKLELKHREFESKSLFSLPDVALSEHGQPLSSSHLSSLPVKQLFLFFYIKRLPGKR